MEFLWLGDCSPMWVSVLYTWIISGISNLLEYPRASSEGRERCSAPRHCPSLLPTSGPRRLECPWSGPRRLVSLVRPVPTNPQCPDLACYITYIIFLFTLLTYSPLYQFQQYTCILPDTFHITQPIIWKWKLGDHSHDRWTLAFFFIIALYIHKWTSLRNRKYDAYISNDKKNMKAPLLLKSYYLKNDK